jgi:DNA (cytosine-5)-methyltransferase 1
MKAVDLFCGCGGMSAGIQSAGFEVIAGVDIERKYLLTFSHNFPKALSMKTDICQLPPEEFMSALKLKRGELDLLAGGPPCQGFSKNVPRSQRFLEDPNNQLVRRFLDYVEMMKPRFVIMENVAEMKNGFEQSYSDEILERLVSNGYETTHAVLNAADFGVPQRRRRAFFVAGRDGITPSLPQPRYSASSDTGGLFPLNPHVTVREAIGDLPSVKHGEGEEETLYAADPGSAFQKLMRNGHDRVRNHKARYLQPMQYY